MSNRVWDNTALPVSKSDLKGVPSGGDPTKYLRATDWNEISRGWVADLAQASKDIQAWSMVSLLDPKYGVVGDGSADDTAGVQAWLNDVASQALYGKAGFIPKGSYRITATLIVPSSSGMMIHGSGRSSNFVWDGTAGTKVFNVKPGYHCVFSHFLLTLPAVSASKVPSHVLFMANPGGDSTTQPYAISGHKFLNVLIEGEYGSAQKGIYWEDTYGNASEITYVACSITGPKTSVQLPGTQQKSHAFFGCQLGECDIGVRCGGGVANPGAGGSFVWYGGGVGTARYSAFTAEADNDPIEIRGCQSEHCNRFFDTVPPGQSPPVPTRGVQAVTITGCRLDTAADGGTGITPQYASYIRAFATGPYEIRGNSFNADEPLRIQVGTTTTALEVVNNVFASAGSVAVSPVNFDDTLGVTRWTDLRMHGNRFASADQVLSDLQRLEGIDTYVLAGGDDASRPALVAQNGNHYLLALPGPTASATSQGIHTLTLPKGTRVKPVGVLVYSHFSLSGSPDIFVSVGTSSGGQELMLEQKVSVSDSTRLGLTGAEWGPLMLPEGVVPNYFDTTAVYVNWRSSSGNLGNGSSPLFTGGLGFLLLEAERDPRWLQNI